MQIVINKNGTRKYYYEKGDKVYSAFLNKVLIVDSVKDGYVYTDNGVIIKLTPDIRPSATTLDNAKITNLRDNKPFPQSQLSVSSNKPKLYFAKTHPQAVTPSKRDEDVGYDCYALSDKTIVIMPCSVYMINTGIAIACDNNYFPKFFDKGGMGSSGLIVGAGVGDSGYRNSYFVPIINTNRDKFFILSNQSDEEVAKCDYFSFTLNKFINSKDITDEESKIGQYTSKDNCIIKYLNKAFCQFVMLPVPQFDVNEISWEELRNIPSERGMGNLGSTGK